MKFEEIFKEENIDLLFEEKLMMVNFCCGKRCIYNFCRKGLLRR